MSPQSAYAALLVLTCFAGVGAVLALICSDRMFWPLFIAWALLWAATAAVSV